MSQTYDEAVRDNRIVLNAIMMAEANKLDFECVGSGRGPYGFEVATPSSGVISWQED